MKQRLLPRHISTKHQRRHSCFTQSSLGHVTTLANWYPRSDTPGLVEKDLPLHDRPLLVGGSHSPLKSTIIFSTSASDPDFFDLGHHCCRQHSSLMLTKVSQPLCARLHTIPTTTPTFPDSGVMMVPFSESIRPPVIKCATLAGRQYSMSGLDLMRSPF